MSVSSTTLDVKGRPTEIVSVGTGEPLVFLHGGGIMEGFDFLQAAGDQGFRVIAPLLPGYGATELDPPVASRDALADHMQDVLDALGIERTVLVGHSLGGWRAAGFAARYPERVEALILAAPLGMEVPGHPLANLAPLSLPERLVALTNDPSIWEGRIPDGPDPAFQAARAREMASMSRFIPGPSDPDIDGIVSRLAAPTQLLWGDDDGIIPFEHSAAWERAIPGAELEIFPSAGHMLFAERPEAMESIRAFVDSQKEA
ncbi:MAG TPA: alpha/beta fold hydrolase [Solirubrobacteraceae bacterium]|nr:alpha/beta fold hydrolase [Solirubrobacteraceae bacterium]